VGRPGKGGGSISIAQTGTQVTLEWLGELETAENVTGPWAAIEASSPLTFSPSDLARYYRGVQADIGGQPGGGDQVTWGPTPIFSDDLENGAAGWTHKAIGEDMEDPWELGTPSSEDYGPVAAASGQNVWGTVLGGNYPDDSNASLRTPPIDLTGVEAATLVYTEFRDVEAPDPVSGDWYDVVQINILSASNPDGEPLAEELRSKAGSLLGWVSRRVKLPEEVLGKKIIIEFRFIADELNEYDQGGWYIDDVVVLPE
jgi:bacillopeptidase F